MTDADDNELRRLRERVDALNERLFAVLDERAALMAEIARRKRALGVPIRDPAREADEFARVCTDRPPGTGLGSDARERILRVILDECRRIQESSG